jgi:hypothetical protein
MTGPEFGAVFLNFVLWSLVVEPGVRTLRKRRGDRLTLVVGVLALGWILAAAIWQSIDNLYFGSDGPLWVPVLTAPAVLFGGRIVGGAFWSRATRGTPRNPRDREILDRHSERPGTHA